MAVILKKCRALLKTPVGQVVEVLFYAGLLMMVLIYFTGNGMFVYEAF